MGSEMCIRDRILRDPSILGYGFVFLCGMINDVVLSLPIGTSSLSYLFVALVAAYVRNATVRSTLFTDWFTFVVAILLGNIISYFLIQKFSAKICLLIHQYTLPSNYESSRNRPVSK